jgi:hypothetical protein
MPQTCNVEVAIFASKRFADATALVVTFRALHSYCFSGDFIFSRRKFN